MEKMERMMKGTDTRGIGFGYIIENECRCFGCKKKNQFNKQPETETKTKTNRNEKEKQKRRKT